MTSSLADLRRFYAAYVLGQAEVDDDDMAAAFETVPREKFCGDGPWKVHTQSGYIDTPSDDLGYLYQDILIALDPDRGVNNGQPSLHARSIAAAAPKQGDRVLHIGAGTGYYSAILAQLVGPTGHVEARKIDSDMATKAGDNLSERANVTVINRSGSAPGLPISDLVYVNAGAPRVVTAWLDALADGGRLIFPLTAGFSMGSMLLVTRHGGAFAARFTSPASFIPYIGAEDPGADERLSLAYRSGAAQDVKSLLRGAEPPDDSCWLAGDGWWLSRRGLSARN